MKIRFKDGTPAPPRSLEEQMKLDEILEQNAKKKPVPVEGQATLADAAKFNDPSAEVEAVKYLTRKGNPAKHKTVGDIIRHYPEQIDLYGSEPEKALGFLCGQVFKEFGGKMEMPTVEVLVKKRLEELCKQKSSS